MTLIQRVAQRWRDWLTELQIIFRRELAISACVWGDSKRERHHTLAMYKLIAKRSPKQIERMERTQGIYRGSNQNN